MEALCTKCLMAGGQTQTVRPHAPHPKPSHTLTLSLSLSHTHTHYLSRSLSQTISFSLACSPMQQGPGGPG